MFSHAYETDPSDGKLFAEPPLDAPLRLDSQRAAAVA
jgi:hypothetical protein